MGYKLENDVNLFLLNDDRPQHSENDEPCRLFMQICSTYIYTTKCMQHLFGIDIYLPRTLQWRGDLNRESLNSLKKTFIFMHLFLQKLQVPQLPFLRTAIHSFIHSFTWMNKVEIIKCIEYIYEPLDYICIEEKEKIETFLAMQFSKYFKRKCLKAIRWKFDTRILYIKLAWPSLLFFYSLDK